MNYSSQPFLPSWPVFSFPFSPFCKSLSGVSKQARKKLNERKLSFLKKIFFKRSNSSSSETQVSAKAEALNILFSNPSSYGCVHLPFSPSPKAFTLGDEIKLSNFMMGRWSSQFIAECELWHLTPSFSSPRLPTLLCPISKHFRPKRSGRRRERGRKGKERKGEWIQKESAFFTSYFGRLTLPMDFWNAS